MAKLTDTDVNAACARFCGWRKAADERLEGEWWVKPEADGYLEVEIPDYFHSPDAADELMRALQSQGYCLSLRLNGGQWSAEITSGHGPHGDYIRRDWKEALATAVAQIEIDKERALDAGG